MDKIKVSVAYALPELQTVLELEVDSGSTVEQAILQSGILSKFPDINLDTNKTGIYGKVEKLNTILQAKDRIEIYRAITCDPKEVRRQRAKKKK